VLPTAQQGKVHEFVDIGAWSAQNEFGNSLESVLFKLTNCNWKSKITGGKVKQISIIITEIEKAITVTEPEKNNNCNFTEKI